MSIKIIKKRHVEEARPPAPLVDISNSPASRASSFHEAPSGQKTEARGLPFPRTKAGRQDDRGAVGEPAHAQGAAAARLHLLRQQLRLPV